MLLLPIKRIAQDLLFNFYPDTCVVCGKTLIDIENHLCLRCAMELPRNQYHLQNDNKIEKVFWGRVPVEAASAYFSYEKGNGYAQILHQLKYKGNKAIGNYFGQKLGLTLKENSRFPIDCIIPVPLHPKKFRKRGYNQSLEIAKGVNSVMPVRILSDVVIRTHNNTSQTKRGRFDRFKNSENLFRIEKPELLEEKNVLIVDDVITTGSTLEAFISEILSAAYCKIYVATLAYA